MSTATDMKWSSRWHAKLAFMFGIAWTVTAIVAGALYNLSSKATLMAALLNLFALGNFLMNTLVSHAYLIAIRLSDETD